MDPENLINNRILSIIDDFFNTVNVRDPVMPSYYIVQNIATEYLILNPNISNPDSSFVKSLNEYNGLMVPPEEINGTFIVLINQDRLIQNIHKNNMTWVGTIIHETTHVQDFVQYAKIINAKKIPKSHRTISIICFRFGQRFTLDQPVITLPENIP